MLHVNVKMDDKELPKPFHLAGGRTYCLPEYVWLSNFQHKK
jgi:hypothetical protein